MGETDGMDSERRISLNLLFSLYFKKVMVGLPWWRSG